MAENQKKSLQVAEGGAGAGGGWGVCVWWCGVGFVCKVLDRVVFFRKAQVLYHYKIQVVYNGQSDNGPNIKS